jgi:nifR3 family TIM-barrel protein
LDFWQKFKTPIYALAPMEDVTDTVFRELILDLSSVEFLQLLFTEFTSVDGLLHPKGREIVSQRLLISTGERKLLIEKDVKIIVQLWGSDPENFYRASRIIGDDYSFDGIDINMGCPVKKIVNQGGCSALILQPELAREIIQAVKEGSQLPVSVKTRIGYNTVETEKWISNLLIAEPSAITIHVRTRKMQSEGHANWNEVAKAVNLRNEMGKVTKIIGNGDIKNIQEADEKVNFHHVDGVMIGRGIFSNPWLFSDQRGEITIDEKINLLLKHAELFTEIWGNRKNFAILRRFFKIYLSGFPGAVAMRETMMNADDINDVKQIILESYHHNELIK